MYFISLLSSWLSFETLFSTIISIMGKEEEEALKEAVEEAGKTAINLRSELNQYLQE